MPIEKHSYNLLSTLLGGVASRITSRHPSELTVTVPNLASFSLRIVRAFLIEEQKIVKQVLKQKKKE